MVASGDDASPVKRQKLAHQDNKPIYDMGIVLLQRQTEYVAQVSLLNFQASVLEKVKNLVEVFDVARRCKFYTHNVSVHLDGESVERWAHWLTHRGLLTVDFTKLTICEAFWDTEIIGDGDYQDATMDAWISWLQTESPAKLIVQRLRQSNSYSCPINLCDLNCALILHHDADAVPVGSDDESPYTKSVCKRVRSMALYYFTQTEREPKDPLQLSDDEFCKRYHSHLKKGQPCYKTKTLTKEA